MNAIDDTELAFPATQWFQRLAGFLEQDPDFRQHAAFLTSRIGFRVDQSLVTLAFERGFVLEVQPGSLDYEFLVSGTRAQWDYLFERKWGLVRLYRAGILAVRGDPVRLMQNWKAIFFIVEGMKRFEESLQQQA